ncbi:divergent protein kinase domain 1B [Electrophorus electricus]|uniref:FAM69 N-terminal domain-containing protein n=1 Tax=Electrophorus electricus TaxID=8005 RepID=A0A4W4EGJ9_ELEEL|nr:divergent protein kinase domain 1B [Electrophorus electricus]
MPRNLRRLMHLVLLCPLSKGLQSRLPAVKVKYLVVTWLGVLVSSWVIYMQYSSYSELCRGHVCTVLICEHYQRGIISGSVCKSLCEEKTLTLQRCLSTSPTHQVYSAVWKEKAVVVKCALDEAVGGDGPPGPGLTRPVGLYDKPARGTSMDEFREMLHSFLKDSLGEQSSLGSLVSRVVSLADVNLDGRVSLAEAKAAWALLHVDEFVLLLALQDKEHAPLLLGHCGHLYVTERVAHAALFTLEVPAWARPMVPEAAARALNRWLAPAWPHRVRIAIGLLEFVEEAFHGAYGSLYMCDGGARAVGYSTSYDCKLADLGGMASEAAVRAFLRGRACRGSDDCTFGRDCSATCDRLARRCNTEVVRPNLAKACALLADFLLFGAPSDLRDDLERQLRTCATLSGLASQMEVHHSLVLSNLKTLLWKEISDTKYS